LDRVIAFKQERVGRKHGRRDRGIDARASRVRRTDLRVAVVDGAGVAIVDHGRVRDNALACCRTAAEAAGVQRASAAFLQRLVDNPTGHFVTDGHLTRHFLQVGINTTGAFATLASVPGRTDNSIAARGAVRCRIL